MPGRLSRRPLAGAALLVVAAAVAAAALTPRHTPLAAMRAGALPRQAAELRPVAALAAYRAPVRPHHAPRPRPRVKVAVATPAPTVAPTPVATAAPPRVVATPVVTVRPAPVHAPAPATGFDSSGTFESSR